MATKIIDQNGNVLGKGDQTREVLQAYADLKGVSLTLTDSKTGKVTGSISPRKRAHNAFSFRRTPCLVRVHPDDKQTIYDAAKMLNSVRQGQQE